MKKSIDYSLQQRKDNIVEADYRKTGQENIYICTNTPELREMLNMRVIKQSNILSTENYFYEKSLKEITRQPQNITQE